MRLIHTADWHLGQTLHEQPRAQEHARFLAWLLDTLVRTEADALLIAGDVFDSANPPTAALAAFYRFVADARDRCPDLDVVVIAGNHDSAARLDAPRPLFAAQEVHVVGAVPRRPDGALATEQMVFPLFDRRGEIGAWVAAVPYLRPADLPRVEGAGDPLVEGVRALYAEVLDAARARVEPGQALLAMGHCFMAGTAESELSERKILGGHQHALPASIFPDDVAYVALGHLHLAQTAGADPRVRYSGSPLPLSLAEAHYRHQVLRVDLDAEGAETTVVPVPRVTDMLRLPLGGPGTIDEAVTAIEKLPERDPQTPRWRLPFLEVSVRVDGPEPGLRTALEAAAEGRAARLVRIKVERPDRGEDGLPEQLPDADLSGLTPEEVFRRRWARDQKGDPPDPLLAAFHTLVEQVAGAEGTD